MQESLDRKWMFCIATGIQPSEYDEMTMDDYNAAAKAYKKMNSKGEKSTYG